MMKRSNRYSRILVTGASGYVGSRLIPYLLEKGYSIRAIGRSMSSLKSRAWYHHKNVECQEVDIFDIKSLLKACVGCDAAYYLIHSMNPRQKKFEEADRQAAFIMSSAAKSAGLKQIIYLGGLGDTKEQSLSKHLKSRTEVSDILHAGQVPVTTLRAAMIIGSGSVSFEILSYLVCRLPVMIAPRWVSTKSQPIAIRNVLHYLIECLGRKEVMGEVFDIGGPEILSYRDLMVLYAQEEDIRKPLIIPVPVLTPRLSSYWINLVTPISASLARPLTEGLRNETICQEHRIRELIAQPLLTPQDAIHRAIQRKKKKQNEQEDQSFIPENKIPGDPAWVGGQC